METKPFASLSSGLLARKGNARPAMRPQGFGSLGGGSVEDLGWNDMGHSSARMAELTEPVACAEARHTPALIPMNGDIGAAHFDPGPPVVEQQRAAIAASFAEPAREEAVPAIKTTAAEPEETGIAVRVPEPREAESLGARAPVASARAKAAFTLRLEAERHLKLRLACAVSGRSAQQLVTEALDKLLESKPEIAALAERLPVSAK
jgi:hypothetical protein